MLPWNRPSQNEWTRTADHILHVPERDQGTSVYPIIALSETALNYSFHAMRQIVTEVQKAVRRSDFP